MFSLKKIARKGLSFLLFYACNKTTNPAPAGGKAN